MAVSGHLLTFLNLTLSIKANNRPFSKSFSFGVKSDDFVELRPWVSLVGLWMTGFKYKIVFHVKYFTNISHVLISAFVYCVSMHLEMFFGGVSKVEPFKRLIGMAGFA